MLLTGVETDHRLHQATGQGLILFALWFAALMPLLRAGWRGERPSAASGLLHLTFVAVGALCSVAAPGGGAPILLAIIAISGALVWWALPLRPSFRSLGFQVDPLLTPIALLAGALYTPYALGQIALQNDATGHHAINPHYFDMAWLTLTLVVLGALAAVFVAARPLALVSGAGSIVLGAAGLALGESTTWSLVAAGLGVLTISAAGALRSTGGRRAQSSSRDEAANGLSRPGL
jgi:hypothetical protein